MPVTSGKGALPVDAREAIQWFVNNFGLYMGSTRGLFITDWGEEREATLEAAIINLKSRGFNPLPVTGDTLFKQADYLWKESRAHSTFGRPLASKLELEIGGADIVIVDNLEAPENSRQLWYLYSHLLYPRAIAGKATVITTPLSFQEFVRYGSGCPDPDFAGRGINWEKLLWLIEASMITLDTFKLAREESLPPMLKAEYYLYTALKERGMDVVPQHVLGDFLLDFALIDKEHKLNIECDTISALGGSDLQRQDAKRNLVLLSDGWQVLKFTTSEIVGGKGACADVVDDVWRSGRKRGATGRLLTGNTVAPMPDLPVDDDVQLSAITYGGGPAAIAGGAGTGKTTCIIQRVAYLIGQGINPENILVLTHGTETQRALKRAIEQVVEKSSYQKLTISSWHDFGLKFLKENLPAIKRKPPLKVESSPQKIIQRLLAKAKKEIDPAKLELSVDLDEFYISAVISMYKSHLISPKQAKEEAATYGEEIIAKIYQSLEDQLQKANRIDRDDVVTLTVQVMLDNPEVRSKYQRQYEFVLVDEYQDATVAQDMLARLLAAPQDNLFVVGDEDEALAESKNACPELFTEYSLRVPHARCYVLERNWRSHPAIVDHARQLLTGLQKRRFAKEFVSAWGQAPASAIIGPTVVNDEHEEANWVANEIQLLVDSGRTYGDIAILYRHHVYATILEEALNNKGVRYQASNPINNFIPDEAADMMAFLKLVMDPDGPRARESFERVCSLRSREIDPKLSATIASFAEANNLSYLKAVEIYSEATADQSCRELEQLVRIIRTMHQEKLPPAETISLIRRTQRLNDYYRNIKVPPGVNYEPLKKLTQLEEESRAFKTISDFVKHITNAQQSPNGGDNGVQVLHLLDSRGLEFPIVFMVGMAEGIFPAQNAIDLEEERRICYVGFTRGKDLLYLSYPMTFSGAMLQPSHFLIDARLMVAPPPMVPSQPVADQAGGMTAEQLAAQTAYEQQLVAQQAYEQQVAAQQAQQTYEQQLAAQQAYEQQLAAQQAQQVYEQQLAAQQAYEQQLAAQQAYQQQLAAQQAYEQQLAAQQAYEQQLAAQQAYEAQLAAQRAEQEQRLREQQLAAQRAEEERLQREQQQAAQRAAEEQQLAAQRAAEEQQRLAAQRAAEEQRQLAAQRATEEQQLTAKRGAQQQEQLNAQRPAEEQQTAAQKAEAARQQKEQDLARRVKAEEELRAKEAEAERLALEEEAARQAALRKNVPAPSFEVYTADQQVARPSMPALPKSKHASSAQPAMPAEVSTPQTPAQQAPAAQLPAAPVPQPQETQRPAPLPVSKTQPAAMGPTPDQLPESLVRDLAQAFEVGKEGPYAAPTEPAFERYAMEQTSTQPSYPQAPSTQSQQPWQAHQAQQPSFEPQQQPVQPSHQPPTAPASGNSFIPQQAYVPQHAYPTQHAPVESHADGDGHPICPSCHTALEANARFCGDCGYTLPERVPACPTCGAPLESTAKFCGECGTSLNSPIASNSSNLNDNLRRMQDLKDQQNGWVNKLFKMLES